MSKGGVPEICLKIFFYHCDAGKCGNLCVRHDVSARDQVWL